MRERPGGGGHIRAGAAGSDGVDWREGSELRADLRETVGGRHGGDEDMDVKGAGWARSS